MKNPTRRLLPKATLLAAGLTLAATLPAAEITKTDDANALNLGTSWVGGVVPGAGDIALFDNTLTAVRQSQLGADVEWAGIKVLGPGGTFRINTPTGSGDTAPILTLGASGIDMSAATGNLDIWSRVRLSADQTWSVANSRILQIVGWGTSNADGKLYDVDLGGFTLTKTGAGTLNIVNGYGLNNGTLVIGGGTVQMSANSNRATGARAGATVQVDSGASLSLWNNVASGFTAGGITYTSADMVQWDATLRLNGGRFNYSQQNDGAINLRGTIEAVDGTTSEIIWSNNSASAAIHQRDISSSLTGTGILNIRSTTLRLNDRLTLLGDNSAFAGTLIVFSSVANSNRTLRLGAAQSGSAAATWNIAADNTLEVHGVDVSLGGLGDAGTVRNSGSSLSTLTIGGRGSDTTFSGVLNGGTAGFRLVKEGAGTFTLAGTNTGLSGGVLLRQGTLAFTTTGAFGGGDLTLGDGSTPAGTLTLAFTDNNSAARTVATAITVAASDAAEVRLGRAATANSAVSEVNYTGQVTLARDLTLFNDTAGAGQTRFNGKITGTGDLKVDFAGTGSNPGIILANTSNGSNDFVGDIRLGSGSLLQIGVNSGTSDVVPNASRILFEAATGTFRLSNAGETIAGLHSLVAGGGTVTTNRTTAGGGSVTLTLAQTDLVETPDFGGLIADQAASAASWKLNLTKSAAGTQRLSGVANTYAGITTVAGGTLEVAKLADGGANSSIGKSDASAANLVLNGGTLRYLGAGDTSDRLFTLSANGALFADGTAALVLSGTGSVAHNNPANNRALTLSGANTDNNSLAAQLDDPDGAGTLRLVKSGAGTWILSGANTYSGGTTVNAGILRLGAAGALGTGPVTLAGGTLDLDGLGFAGEITLAGGLLANAANWTGTAVAGAGADAAALNALAQSTVTVRSGSLSLAGVTKDILLEGGAVNGLATFDGNLVASGGTVDLSAGDFAGTLGLTGGTADFGDTVSSRAISYSSGAVAGANFTGDIVVTGANVSLGASLAAGTVVLTAGNSAAVQAGFGRDIRFEGGTLADFGAYAGLITVANGATFDLDGAANAPVTTTARLAVANGSRLKGTGTVGDLVVRDGGILAPGNSPGIMTVDGDFVLEAGGALEIEVLSALGLVGEPAPGDDIDQVVVTGTLDLSALGSGDRFILQLVSLADSTTPGDLFDFDPAGTYSFTFLEYGTLDLGANIDITDLFTVDTTGFTDFNGNAVSAADFTLSDTGSALVLSYVAPIPEPSTYGLALGALALAGAALRRRKKKD
jgi:fibronectin-binding autotransporter adhesin